MLNVQIPASDIGGGQVVTTHFGCLNVPNEAIEAVAAVLVLVANSNGSRGHSVNSLKLIRLVVLVKKNVL